MHPFNDSDMREIAVLLWGAALAGLAWVARSLMKGARMTPLRFAGGVLGAAVAAFSFGALLDSLAWITPVMKLGISGVVGWVGGDVLSALARELEKRLGWRIREE